MHLSLPVSTCETLKRSAQWTSRLARISSTGFALPSAAPTRLAYAHARLRYELARWSAQQVRGRCLTKPDKVLHRQLSDASIIQTKCTKSNIVPAPGLEPGRSQLQRLVGCQLPYAGSTHTLLRINEYRDRESTIPAGPPSRYSRILGIHGSSATRFAHDVPSCLRLPSLRSCGRGLRYGTRRCAGSRDSSRPRFSAPSSGCGASTRGHGTDPATRR